jgi:hypothetical protein
VIRDEAEYRRAVALVREEQERLTRYATEWAERGYTPEQVAKLLEPLECLHLGRLEKLEIGQIAKPGCDLKLDPKKSP